MPTVYVVQEMNKFNYSDAERFGELKFITTKEFRPYKTSDHNADVINSINEFAAGFSPDEDYLLMTGNPIAMSYAFHKALTIKGHIRLLQWDGISRRYQECHFNTDDFS